MFSQFLGMLAIIRQQLEEQSIPYVYFDGSSSATEREKAILDANGLAEDSFQAVKAIAEGTRRDAAIIVGNPSVQDVDGGVEVAFTLPGGAYATAVMREVMKSG